MQRDRRSRRTRAAVLVAGLALALGSLGGGPSAGASGARDAGRRLDIPNVRVSHDGYTDHGQPSLAVSLRNPRTLLGAAMASGSGTLVEETFASLDGGRTWQDNGPLPLPPGASFGGDPTVAFDAQGRGFVASLGAALAGDAVYVWRTDDGGRSFRLAVAVEQGQPADHPWLAAGAAPGSGRDDLYVAWATRDVAGLGHAGGLAFSRSTDGGRRFARPRIISAPAGGVSIPVVTAGPGGSVAIAYVTVKRVHPQGGARGAAGDAGLPVGVHEEEVQVVSSADYGRSFGRPVVVGPATSLLAATPDVDLTTQPSLAIDPRDGSIYLAYSAYHTRTAHADILLVRSRDGGRTWGVPVRVMTESASGQTVFFQPHVVVDATGGIDVTCFALRHGRVDVLLARSSTHGASVGALQRITSRAFDPSLGWPGQKTGAWWIGDYQGLAAGGGLIHPFWNDTRTGHLEIFTAAVPLALAK